MIDITIDNNEVRVENKVYHSFNDREALVALIADIVEKTRYSGETVSLWIIRYDPESKKEMKFFVKEWH